MLIPGVGVTLATAAPTRDHIARFTIEARPSGILKYARPLAEHPVFKRIPECIIRERD